MRIAIVAASNNREVLERNLLRSPLVRAGGASVHVETDPPSAALAYNRGLDATKAEIVVFAHHDVYLPEGWDALLARRIEEIGRLDPRWALVGAYGVGEADRRGYGPVWSTSIGHIVGRVATEPIPAHSFDELLIVMRREAGLRFDEALPGFHFFGTDIVQAARAAGRSAWIASLPLIHNDRIHDSIGQDYSDAYHWMRRKWRARLPLNAPTVKISWHGLHLRRTRRHLGRAGDVLRSMALPTDVEPERYADHCGWRSLERAPEPAAERRAPR